ncbi:hypothetical protein CCACVL1_05948 [Corchorus capsularis]|uniref:Uncharacterized protein n=1 Tax=Corchorus capsularis TaxID=210143 RepID=A0A1R3JI12_COCAP|nr:hypothetical protein CCACVL1_05948 [Corchorus capsularis]
MGGLNKLCCGFIIYAMFISQAFYVRARILDGFFKLPVSSDKVFKTEPGLNLVVPQRNFQVRPPAAGYMSANVDQPSKLEDSRKNVGKVILRKAAKQGSGYRPLVLNLLPKGTLPPSGPSKRSNSLPN